MLKARVIPCLDVKDGRVVKGVNFFDLRDAGDPVEQARIYDAAGADELCFLDITASHENRGIILDVVRQTAEEVFMPVTVGGGIREMKDIRNLLNAGADKVAIQTAAVNNPDFIKEASDKCGSQCIVVVVDAKRQADGHWHVYTHGGRNDSGLDALEYAVKMAGYGAGELMITSMDKDGTKSGFDLELLKAVTSAVSVPVIASGGAGNAQHLADGIVKGGASAVLAASIFHFGDVSIAEAKATMKANGIPVREIIQRKSA